jgi:hypothetical protein
MSRSLMFAGVVALLAGGCASSSETERRAQAHDARARQAAAYEDYDHAAQEKHKADRLRAKAAEQRAHESLDEGIAPAPAPIAPSEAPVPPPVTPY